MKHTVIAVFSAFLLAHVSLAAEKPEIKDDSDKISYSLGHQIGVDFKRQKVELKPDLVVKGIEDALAGAEPLMTPAQMRATLVDLKKKVTAAEREERRKASEENMAKGEAFLAENATKEGVKTLPSGLQYKVITEGTGKSPNDDDTVIVHYRGTLISGTEFDSSYKRDKPATFRVDCVIPGWTQALKMMKEGAKWQLFIPAKLAYGERGAGANIPPHSTLVFEVELLSVSADPGSKAAGGEVPMGGAAVDLPADEGGEGSPSGSGG